MTHFIEHKRQNVVISVFEPTSTNKANGYSILNYFAVTFSVLLLSSFAFKKKKPHTFI